MYQLVVNIQLKKDGVFVIGRGRARLLQLIDEKKSISKAAEELKMAYRHAWGILRKMKEDVGVDGVESSRGSVGGTVLTEDGRKLLEKYESLVEQIKTCLEDPAVSQQEIDQYSVALTVFAHLDCFAQLYYFLVESYW